MKQIGGKYERCLHYIARKEAMTEAYLSNGPLFVMGVYPDGSLEPTHLQGYIQSIRQGEEPYLHWIQTSSCKSGHEIKVYVI